jgi:hypothetical protein
LETTGLGPCIGVALIYKSRGFVLHLTDILMESDTADDFEDNLTRKQESTTPIFEHS